MGRRGAVRDPAPEAGPRSDFPFRIDGWLVEPSLNSVTHPDGRGRTQLEPKVMAVLTFLAARPGRVASRQELMDSVWPGTVVSEDPLNRAVSELRKLFADSPRAPRVIETIHKRGYRLIATVERTTADESTRRSTRWRRTWTAVIAVAALAAVVVIVQRSGIGSTGRPTTASPLRTVPLTSYPGREIHPDISPDGSLVAYAWSGPEDGNLDIWIQPASASEPRRLTDTAESEFGPSFSPDGGTIAFSRAHDSRSKILAVPTLGGPERLLYETVSYQSMGYDWSPDGEQLAVADTDPIDGATAIFLVSLGDGSRLRLTDPPEPHLQDSNPDYSPDGRSIAFRRKLGQGHHEVFVVSLDGGDVTQVTYTGQDNGGLDWSAAGNIIFSSNHTGTFSLWSVGPDGGEPRWLGYEGAVKPSVARSGPGLVYERWRFNLDIWRVPAPGVDGRSAVPWLSSSMIDTDPRYSPDGERLAFISLRSGSYELWVVDASGERPTQLTRFGKPAPAWRPSIHHPRWSPDAREVVFATQVESDFDICAVDLASGRVRRLTDGGADHRYPTWGGDGWIYFVSTASGAWQLWRLPSQGGLPERLTEDEAQGPVEIGDDGNVYYRRSWREGVWRLVDGREEQVLAGATTPDWTIGSAGIYRIEYDDERRPTIALYEPGSRDAIWRLPVEGYGPGGFAVSPRDGSILFPKIEADEGDILIARDFDG